MIGLPPIGTVGVRSAQPRDKPRPKVVLRRFVGHDLELTADEMKGTEAIKTAWADRVADAPVMLMGRGADGRFVSLKPAGDV